MLTFAQSSLFSSKDSAMDSRTGARSRPKTGDRTVQKSAQPSAGFDFARMGIQPKLQVSQPGDPYEREADRIAEQIMSRPDAGSAAWQKCTTCKGKEETEIHRKASASGMEVPEDVADEIKNLHGGVPLDPSTREFMESRFGYDFGAVRIHAENNASASAESLGALAYTVGQKIVFQKGMYSPQTRSGQKLIAHELTHVVQQGNAATGVLQRQEEKGAEEEKKDAGEVIAEGLKTVAEQAKDNNPQVKKEIIKPLEKWGKGKWESLSTGEKTAGVSFGVATIGLTAGSLLADPKGRKLLEGVNLGAPFKLIPYMPLTGFSYKLPDSEKGESQFRFETTFSGDDYLKLLTERKNLPNMSLQVKMQWGYDAEGQHLGVLGAQAKIGLMPGLSISAGTYPDVLPMPETFVTSEGRMVTSKQRIPDVSHERIPDTRIMLNIDLLKLDKRIIGKRLHSILMSF